VDAPAQLARQLAIAHVLVDRRDLRLDLQTNEHNTTQHNTTRSHRGAASLPPHLAPGLGASTTSAVGRGSALPCHSAPGLSSPLSRGARSRAHFACGDGTMASAASAATAPLTANVRSALYYGSLRLTAPATTSS
jgi:hypothetical protein